jgi:hypothetical protein
MELWVSFGGKGMDLTGCGDAGGSVAEDRHAVSGHAILVHGGMPGDHCVVND